MRINWESGGLHFGDYDSVNERLLDTYKRYADSDISAGKNYTDTHLAVITALKHHPVAIDILGATGTRYDHALTNIFIMKQALKQERSAAFMISTTKFIC